MHRFTAIILSVLLMTAASIAKADDQAVVEAFYTQLLSAPNAADLEDRVRKVVTEDRESIPTPRGGKGAEGMIKTLRFFGSKVPDLKWNPQEILRDGNRYTVRSIATGTPKDKFFGIEPKAGFEIMTIDIHEVKDGKIVKSYHVEEWAKAIQQVKGQGH